MMHKRQGFSHENELRLLKFDGAHYAKLLPQNAARGELDDHIYLDWFPANVIDEIVISPYPSEDFERTVRAEIGSIDPALLDRTVLSVMHERRYRPNF